MDFEKNANCMFFEDSEKVEYYKDAFTKSGAGTIDCRVDESYVKKLLGYFKRR